MGKRVLLIAFLTFLIGSCLFCMVTGAEKENTTEIKEELPVTLVIHKVDGETRLPVTGAEFLFTKEDGTYLSLNAQGTVSQWVKNKEKASVLVSDEDGKITIEGILPGVYSLTEIKAPNGYNLLEESLTITITARYTVSSSGETEISELSAQVGDGDPVFSTADNPNVAEITVENVYGTVLPDTGGIGAVIYYMLGVIVLFAVCLTVTAKRLVRQER